MVRRICRRHDEEELALLPPPEAGEMDGVDVGVVVLGVTGGPYQKITEGQQHLTTII